MKNLFLAIAIMFLSAASVWAQPTPTPTATATPAPTVAITPVAPIIAHGTSVQMIATLNAQNPPNVTWLSSNPTAATISATGLVTGVAAGMSTIQAQSNGNAGWTTVTVY